jgi:hypothetical protein
MLVMLRVALPLFFSVTDCAALVVPTVWLENVRLLGVRLTGEEVPRIIHTWLDDPLAVAWMISVFCVLLDASTSSPLAWFLMRYPFPDCVTNQC